METWLLLSLLYPAVYAFVNLVDKFLLEKKVKNCFSLCIVSGIVVLAIGIIVAIVFPFEGLTMRLAITGLVAGLVYSVGYASYFYAVSFEEISRVVSILYTTPIFVLLFAVVFLGESLPAWKYGAIASAVAGAVLIGVEKFELKPVMRKAFWIIIISCIFYAGGATISKYLLGHLSFWNVFAIQSYGAAFGLLTILFSKNARAHLKHTFKSLHIIVLSEIIDLCATMMFLAAVSMTAISKVSAMGSIQPLYLLIVMFVLSAFMPKLLKEVYTKKTLGIKMVSVLLIVVGAYFVAI